MHGRALAASIGRVGAWSFALDEMSSSDGRAVARTVEELGFGALWLPETQGSKEALSQAAVLLAATGRLPIATGIANVWGRDAAAMANGARALWDAFPGRFLLGIGISTPEHDQNSLVDLMRNGWLDSVQVIYNIFDQEPQAESETRSVTPARLSTSILAR